MNTKRILFVDDDINILGAFQRQLRKRYEIETAVGPDQGLAALDSKDPYAVMVVDMNMPGLSGVEFLKRAITKSPTTIRVMLTGNADQATAVHAVNEGHVFQFLNKPCSPEILTSVLDAALRQHDLENAERELLENTLKGSIRVLVEVLSLALPRVFEFSRTLCHDVRTFASHLHLSSKWDLEVAAMLSQLGHVAVPQEVITKFRNGEQLSEVEHGMLDRVPELGYQLIAKIPRLEGVAQMVRYQRHAYTGNPLQPEAISGERLPLGARVLKLLVDLNRIEERGLSRASALEVLRGKSGQYDPKLLDALLSCFDTHSTPTQEPSAPPIPVTFKQLEIGMTLAECIETTDGSVIVCGGHEVTQTLLERLRNFVLTFGIKEPIYIKADSRVTPPGGSPHADKNPASGARDAFPKASPLTAEVSH